MNHQELYKNAVIDALADRDIVYQNQMRQLVALEKQFDKLVGGLPDADRALIWDYVMLCEDMSQRKQQLACQYVVFPADAMETVDPLGDWTSAAEKTALKVMK